MSRPACHCFVASPLEVGIPILVSRSGFTAWGVELARKAGPTLGGRARGRRFLALAGQERIVSDLNPVLLEDERGRRRRETAGNDA